MLFPVKVGRSLLLFPNPILENISNFPLCFMCHLSLLEVLVGYMQAEQVRLHIAAGVRGGHRASAPYYLDYWPGFRGSGADL